jgi:hypothetical protein
MKKVLELFAGSRSVGKACEELGMEVFSTDIEQFGGIDYICDIFDFDYDKVPFIPDVVWASPPCTGFSVAAIGKNWVKGEDFTPKTPSAEMGIKILKKTLSIMAYYKRLNPNLIFYFENPRGKMRKAPYLQPKEGLIRHTVTYCQYEMDKPAEERRMKPTDIWTNNPNWTPRPSCKNGMPCHVSAPRGSSTGTQGLKGNHERSKIPHELCVEVMKAV